MNAGAHIGEDIDEDAEARADLEEEAAYMQTLIATPERFVAWVNAHAGQLGDREDCTDCPVYWWLRSEDIAATDLQVFSRGAELSDDIEVHWGGTWLEKLIIALDGVPEGTMMGDNGRFTRSPVTEAEVFAILDSIAHPAEL